VIPEPALRPAELELLMATVRGLTLEFGSGGSTLALLDAATRVVSVESDPEWARRVRAFARFLGKAERLEVRYIDIGPVADYGRPQDPGASERWPAYWRAGDDLTPDVVFIDGRFRVACGLNALRWGVQVAIHDFRRAHYQVLLDHYTVTEQVDTLAVLAPKAAGGATSRLQDYARDPA
jgi:hypothetical protein